jgi:hypothetical protein
MEDQEFVHPQDRSKQKVKEFQTLHQVNSIHQARIGVKLTGRF